jgi:hypothetical protein
MIQFIKYIEVDVGVTECPSKFRCACRDRSFTARDLDVKAQCRPYAWGGSHTEWTTRNTRPIQEGASLKRSQINSVLYLEG